MVGYGDIVFEIIVGKCFLVVLILLGYSFIIVFMGFVLVNLFDDCNCCISICVCESCFCEGYDVDVKYCKYCGVILFEFFLVVVVFGNWMRYVI